MKSLSILTLKLCKPTFHMVTVASMPTSLAPTKKTSKRRDFFARIFSSALCLSARWHHMALPRKISWVRTHVHHTYGAPWAGFSTGWASLKAGSVFVQMGHIQGYLNLFSLIWSVIHSWKKMSINICISSHLEINYVQKIGGLRYQWN